MIHSARPTVSPVANIVFASFCFARFWKVGTDGRTTCAKTIIPTGCDCGSAEWINNCISIYLPGLLKEVKEIDLSKNDSDKSEFFLFFCPVLFLSFLTHQAPSQIGGHEFVLVVSVRLENKKRLKPKLPKKNKHTLKRYMGAWWVTLTCFSFPLHPFLHSSDNSQNVSIFYISLFCREKKKKKKYVTRMSSSSQTRRKKEKI